MKRISNIIFDLDGVIIDSQPIYFKVEKELFKELNLKISEKEHHSFVGVSMQDMWKVLKQKKKKKKSVELLVKNHKNRMLNYFRTKPLKAIANVEKLIKYFYKNHYKLALASSSARELIEIILRSLNLKSYFPIITSGEEFENGKPAPDIFLKTVNLLNCENDRCVVIEDSSNGVLAAKRANIMCIGYANPHSGNQDLAKADIIVNNHQQIIDIFDN